MQYNHRFEVSAPLEAVVDFHRQSASMAAITPPPIVVRVHSAPQRLMDGDQMDFTMWLGPFPIRWVAQIEALPQNGFLDRQCTGPFAKWEHRHRFERIDDRTTAVLDEVTAELHDQWFWKSVGFGMWINLPILFAYRGWKTKKILARQSSTPEQNRFSSTSPSAR